MRLEQRPILLKLKVDIGNFKALYRFSAIDSAYIRGERDRINSLFYYFIHLTGFFSLTDNESRIMLFILKGSLLNL
jgi:hypothetical protein